MSDAAYVALALVPGVGRVRLETLLRAFGSAHAVLSASFKQLRGLRGISPAAATAISETTAESGVKVLQQVAAQDGVALTPTDPGFPSVLTEIPDAPTLVFARGRLELLHTSCVAMVGSREHSRYGAEVAVHLASGCARAGVSVVSGMARGLDAVAHEAALDAGGGTIGVLGNGLGASFPTSP